MKKILACFMSLMLIAGIAYSSDISVEPLLNRCLKSDGTALRVSVTGSVSGDTVTAVNISSDTVTCDTLGVMYNNTVRGATVTADNVGMSISMADKLSYVSDGSDIYQKWSDGVLNLSTDEGTNTDSQVNIRGKGTGSAYLRLYDGSNANNYMTLGQVDTAFNITAGGNATDISINSGSLIVDTTIKTKNSATALVVNSDATAGNEYIQANLVLQGNPYSVQKQHDEIGILLDCLTAPKAIVGFTGTGATTTTESGYESGAGRVWTYSGGLATDKIFQGSTYVYSFDGVDSYLSTPDTADMSFGDSSNDSAYSIGGWVQVVADTAHQTILSKWETTTGAELREYLLMNTSGETLALYQYDESANKLVSRISDAALSAGWHFVVATQSGTGGATAMDTAILYVDGVAVASTAANNASYVAMENSAVTPMIGCYKGGSANAEFFTGDMGRLFVTAEALSAATIWKIYESTRGQYNK